MAILVSGSVQCVFVLEYGTFSPTLSLMVVVYHYIPPIVIHTSALHLEISYHLSFDAVHDCD